jgi:hypothetical protein
MKNEDPFSYFIIQSHSNLMNGVENNPDNDSNQIERSCTVNNTCILNNLKMRRKEKEHVGQSFRYLYTFFIFLCIKFRVKLQSKSKITEAYRNIRIDL